MKNLSDESTEARMIRLQSEVKYRDGALGTRIIKELGDYYCYFKHINDDDNCILKKFFKEVKYIKPTPCPYLSNFCPCLNYNLGLVCSENKIGLVSIFDKLVLRWLQEPDEKNDPTIRAYWKPHEIRDIKECGERVFNTSYLLAHELHSLGKEKWLDHIVCDEVLMK